MQTCFAHGVAVNKYSIDLFLESCGALGPLELEAEDQDRQQVGRHLVHQPFALVGRDPEADIALNHEQISHRHTYLQLLNGRLFGVDLASRDGTFWESVGEQSAGWLDRNQAIRVGPVSLRLLAGCKPPPDPSEEDWPNPLCTEPGSGPKATLEFVNLAAGRPPWQMNRGLAFIGRSPLCRVQLASQTVSKFHASLVHTPKGVWVVDLLGKDGTYVNGVRVRSARLDDGDRLRIGKFVIRVSLGESAEGAAEGFDHVEGEAPLAPGPMVVEENLPAPRPSILPAAFPAAPGPMVAEENLPVPRRRARAEGEAPLAPLALLAPGPEPMVAEENLPVPRRSILPAAPAAAPGPMVVEENLPVPRRRASDAAVSAASPPEPSAVAADRLIAPFGELLQKGEFSESMLLPLVNQFGQMQQHMFDQFQQALMMMVQMFGNLHKDQMNVVRQELDRLHGLTRELNRLQDELAQARTEPSRRTAPARAAGARPPSLPPPSPKPARAAGPRLASAPRSENGNHVLPPQPARSEPAEPIAPRPAKAQAVAAERPMPPGGLSGDFIHAQLTDRISALQREQQGLWQRIVSSLLGKRPDEPMP